MKRLIAMTINDPAHEKRLSVALLVLRIAFGISFILHGVGKIQNPFGWMGPNASVPAFFQFLAALAEFGGGIAMIPGVLTTITSFGLLSTMAVAAMTHIGRGDPYVGRPASWELAGIFFCISLLFLLVGPGKYSVDHYIRSRLKK